MCAFFILQMVSGKPSAPKQSWSNMHNEFNFHSGNWRKQWWLDWVDFDQWQHLSWCCTRSLSWKQYCVEYCFNIQCRNSGQIDRIMIWPDDPDMSGQITRSSGQELLVHFYWNRSDDRAWPDCMTGHVWSPPVTKSGHGQYVRSLNQDTVKMSAQKHWSGQLAGCSGAATFEIRHY